MELTESETLRSSRIVKQRRDNNIPVYNAGLGSNPFPPHEKLLEIFKNNIDNKNYTSPAGIESLQKTIINNYSNDNYTVTNTIIGNGLKELLFVLLTYLKSEYKLYLIAPYWCSYQEQTKITGIEYEVIQTNKASNYKVTSFELDRYFSNTSKKPVLILNNPTNPTGAIYYKEELKELSKIFRRHDVLIISDEIYMNMVYPENKHLTESITRYYNKTIVGSSLSKEFTTGGWRLGWLTFTKELESIYKNIFILSSSIYSCASTPLQLVANEALKYPTDVLDYINYMNEFFSKLGNYCYARFNDMDLITSKPFAAWYIFIDFSNYKKKLSKKGIIDSAGLVKKLINDIGLVTVSGKSFGYKYLTLRYSFVDVITPEADIPYYKKIINITTCLNKLENWVHSLS